MDEGYFVNSRVLYYFTQHNKIYLCMCADIFHKGRKNAKTAVFMCLYLQGHWCNNMADIDEKNNMFT